MDDVTFTLRALAAMGLDLDDFPCASPELVWACVKKNSQYVKGRLLDVGADTHRHASSEKGNLRGIHLARDTGLRHLVTFDLELGEDKNTLLVHEIQPHCHTPASSKSTHTVPYTSFKGCYDDVIKLTHEKRPELDRVIFEKLKALLLSAEKNKDAED